MKHSAILAYSFLLVACTTMGTSKRKLAGTVWTGPSADGATMLCVFKSGGRMSVSAAPATWQQEGSVVTMQINNGYATYTGTIDGSTMSGSASNVAGNQWEWSITRH